MKKERRFKGKILLIAAIVASYMIFATACGTDDKNNNEQKPLQNVSNSTSNSSDESKGQETDKKEVNDQKQTNDNTEKTYVKTGDQTSYVILLLMMFASLIGIFLLKNKKEY